MTGLLCGFPFWYQIVQGGGGESIRAWRVAHTTLIATGIMMLLTGLLLPVLSLTDQLLQILVWSFIVSGYSFVWALAGGAWAGYRGLMPGPLGVPTIFFTGHLLGAAGSLMGVVLMIFGLVSGI